MSACLIKPEEPTFFAENKALQTQKHLPGRIQLELHRRKTLAISAMVDPNRAE